MIFEAEAVIRIFCAVLFGGLIGFEREYRNMPAGFRTHILVCIGSALVMIVSEYMFRKYSGSTSMDPARMGAQVISGIGFLGAGTILRDKFRVTGLTTAASLWAVACIGIAVGIGFYYIAVISTVVIYAILSFLRKFEGLFANRINKSKLTVTAKEEPDVEKAVSKLIEDSGYQVKKLASFKRDKMGLVLKYEIQCHNKTNSCNLTERLLEKHYIIGMDIE
jgi:putative Mg2+ transporter-C (MgtC) family protein